MVRNKDIVKWSSSIVVFLVIIGQSTANKEGYYGKFVGKLSQLHHGVSGDVFAVDARTLHIRNFNYDGEGPAAYFYAGNSKGPGVNGFRLRDERGTTNVLPRYRNKHITVTLPEGKTLQNVRWFSVWCDEFSVNFGDVKIPKNLDFPKPQKINGLSGVHGVSSEPIVIVDAQTLLIPSFSYDGEAPDAKFWVGRGFKPSPQGIRIPDENGKELPLRRYDRKTIVLTLPGDLTIFDIGHFGVWCEAFTVDFGHVQIPRGLNIPPSLKMLGVSPQSKLNCEVLWDDFAYEVRWAVAGDSIVLQLVARLESNEYMSFGLSGDKTRSRMVGGDVVVAWVDKDSLKGYAKDYYLDAKSQCSGGRGSCPDENIAAGTESVRLLNAALVNGYSIVTFQRSLKPSDELDKPVYTNQSQPVIWAVGPLNSRKEVSYHSLANRGDLFIDFGRSPKWNCPTPESTSDSDSDSDSDPDAINREYEEARVQDTRVRDSTRRESRPKTQIPTPAPAPKSGAWEIPSIKCYEPEDGVFYAQMGPTGGKHGYSAITGHVGWGISWYINGLLIPEINVVRGRTYTFIVEGGLDPETPARYHPFYITDDPVGGYQYKTPQERANVQIFAGAVQNKRGEVRPTGVGRLCNWTPDPNAPPADEFTSFGAYQRTLRLECDPGNPGIIQWTVEKDTPDTVYYQCYSHRYLGWKINVHDHCEGEPAASDPVPSIVKAPENIVKAHEVDSEVSESIGYETRVKPDPEFFNIYLKNQTNRPNEFVGQEPVKYFSGLYEQDIKAIQQIPIQQLQVQYPQAVPAIIVQQEPVIVPVPQTASAAKSQPVSENKLIKFAPTHSQRTSGYSVKEEPENVQNFQDFQIVPVQEFQEEVVRIPEPKPENKFLNYQLLRAQEEKLKRNKLQYGKPSRVPIATPNRSRKPVPFHALTLQQRPFPPGAFRPPALSHKPQKRIPPQKHRPLIEEIRQEHRPVRKPPQPSHDLFSSSTVNKESLGIPFAHNNGFDPQSVQVEGGFKPILNTGIAPKIIERSDVEVEDKSDRKIGVIDLSTEETVDKNNLFKNQKPQSFEPIFVPSYPDDSVKKYQEKYKKKPYLSLKPRHEESKNGQVYVKIRPNANLIRRPLYPDVMPFRMQGGMPSPRSQEAEEERQQTEATTFKAENILDVIEMYEANATDAKEQKKEVQDEIAMADDRKDFYLPPKPEFLSYDGKVVKVDVPELPDSPAPDVHKLPQFVPFKGAIPPLTQTVNAQYLPQLKTSKLAREDILPPAERKKRSPDHIPGHVGPHDGDQDHDHHHHHQNGSSSRNSNLLLVGFVLLCLRAASF